METTLRVSGLECDSCAKVIARLAAKSNCTLASIDVATGSVKVSCSTQADLSAFTSLLKDAGYGIDGQALARGNLGRASRFFTDIVTGSNGLKVERKIVEASALSLVLMLALSASVLFIPLFAEARSFVPLLVLTAIGVSACSMALSHYRAFGQPFSCMCGMMVGMTIGMMGGFLSGALAGAANGMFAGSVAGMLIGMGFGAMAGSTTGVMGVLEGLMAGLMGGTMGAMLSVMLFADNVVLFLFMLFAASVPILLGLSYMLWREAGSLPATYAPNVTRMVVGNTLFFILFSAFLVWGPRSTFSWTAG